MRTQLVATIVAAGVVAVAAPAFAQGVPQVAQTQRAPGYHLHDGFYLRLATGFGSYFETINQEGEDTGVVVTGMASVGEVAIGWAVRPGLVLGLGSYGATVLASERVVQDGPVPPSEIMDEVSDFAISGPFIDWYFRARGGLHLQCAIGVATLRGVGVTTGRFDRDEIDAGAGIVLGFGYEWWVSDDWAFGILGRVSAAAVVDEDEGGVRWEHGVGSSPSLLFTATFN